MSQRRNSDTARLTLSALLLSLMLVLGYVESLLPMPTTIPGVKLGLSNGVLIFAVYMLDIPTSYILMTMKVVLSGLLFSGVQAMIYAFAGGLLSLTLMCLMSLDRKMSPVAVSMAGGVSHNVGQVAMVMLVMHATDKLLYYLGILMLVGLVCGLATGIAANSVMKHLKAAHWQGATGRKRRKADPILLITAILAVAAGLFFAWRAMQRSVPVEVVPAEEDADVQLIPDDQFPFSALPTQ